MMKNIAKETTKSIFRICLSVKKALKSKSRSTIVEWSIGKKRAEMSSLSDSSTAKINIKQ
jgi:hypothetical protein